MKKPIVSGSLTQRLMKKKKSEAQGGSLYLFRLPKEVVGIDVNETATLGGAKKGFIPRFTGETI